MTCGDVSCYLPLLIPLQSITFSDCYAGIDTILSERESIVERSESIVSMFRTLAAKIKGRFTCSLNE